MLSEFSGGYWNHRFVQVETDSPYGKEYQYELHEVYYDKDGVVIAITEDPVCVYCYSQKDMKKYFRMYKKALKKTYLIDVKGMYVSSGKYVPRKESTMDDLYKVVVIEENLLKGITLEDELNKYYKEGYKLHSFVPLGSYSQTTHYCVYKVILERKDILKELSE